MSSGIIADFVAPALEGLEPPDLLGRGRVQLTAGRPTPPAQVVHFYDSTEWEAFIREWATGLPEEYVQIKQIGGTNDQGIDVAAFKTHQGFEGPWDCFQGKHYGEPLGRSDVLPEMLKIFRHVHLGHYVMPESYQILAPRGCNNSLERELSAPSVFRKTFLDQLDKTSKFTLGMTDAELSAVRALAMNTDFAVFKSIQFEDALSVHAGTPYHHGRFGGPMIDRPANDPVPDAVQTSETTYVNRLVEVYEERYSGTVATLDDVLTHSTASIHFQRQRVSFYCAESLRKFAASSVPQGTFGRLQKDVFDGVVDVSERAHSSGFERLSRVLEASGALRLTGHELLGQSSADDIKGICHQLANDSKLFWVDRLNS